MKKFANMDCVNRETSFNAEKSCMDYLQFINEFPIGIKYESANIFLQVEYLRLNEGVIKCSP
jgi:hypothetical protein